VFDHVTVRVSDAQASLRFYDTVFAPIGKERTDDGSFVEWDDWGIQQASAEHPVSRNLHVGFWVPSHDLVGAFWRAGVEAGYEDAGEPGPRPQYGDDYFGGFLRDPDGNSIEAVYLDDRPRTPGQIDHLWIRVADVAAARDFYGTLAPHLGVHPGTDEPERAQFRSDTGTFSLVAGGQPTERVHLAFPAPDHATVDAFHAAALAAGHADNGGPGERAQYHPGYYAAFVLDPDGHNVEAVDHGTRGW
jgi:catechol 2,3-dioxygenase-like lactoylglutathione lyase family enzyme